MIPRLGAPQSAPVAGHLVVPTAPSPRQCMEWSRGATFGRRCEHSSPRQAGLGGFGAYPAPGRRRWVAAPVSDRTTLGAELQTAPLPYLAALVMEDGAVATNVWPSPSAPITIRDVSNELRRRFANKSYSQLAVMPADTRAVCTLLAALTRDSKGRHGQTYDVTAGWLVRAVRADSILLADQGEQLCTVLDLFALTRHNSIATVELLREIARKLRWDIAAAHEGKPAPLQQNRLSPQLLLRLLRGFHTHGHYPGERLMDAVGPYIFRTAKSRGSLTPKEAQAYIDAVATFRHHPGRRLLAAMLLRGWKIVPPSPGTIVQAVPIESREERLLNAAQLLHNVAQLDPGAIATPHLHAPSLNLLAEVRTLAHEGPAPAGGLCRLLWSLSASLALPFAQMTATCEALHNGGHLPGVTPQELATLYEAVLLCDINNNNNEGKDMYDSSNKVKAEDSRRQGHDLVCELLGEVTARAAAKAYQQSVQLRHSTFTTAHLDIRAALLAAGLSCRQQVQLASGTYVDFVVGGGGGETAVLVESGVDFASNAPRHRMGAAAARCSLVAASDFDAVVCISTAEWRKLSTAAQRAAFLRDRLPPALFTAPLIQRPP